MKLTLVLLLVTLGNIMVGLREDKTIKTKTTRQAIKDELLLGMRTIRDLSQALRISEKEVIAHLAHVRRSTTHKGYEFVIEPSKCLKCRFIFEHRERWTKPSRCPKCRGEKITTPRFGITSRYAR